MRKEKDARRGAGIKVRPIIPAPPQAIPIYLTQKSYNQTLTIDTDEHVAGTITYVYGCLDDDWISLGSKKWEYGNTLSGAGPTFSMMYSVMMTQTEYTSRTGSFSATVDIIALDDAEADVGTIWTSNCSFNSAYTQDWDVPNNNTFTGSAGVSSVSTPYTGPMFYVKVRSTFDFTSAGDPRLLVQSYSVRASIGITP